MVILAVAAMPVFIVLVDFVHHIACGHLLALTHLAVLDGSLAALNGLSQRLGSVCAGCSGPRGVCGSLGVAAPLACGGAWSTPVLRFALASASVADVETPLGCAAVLVGCVALGAVVVVARAADP